jgi:hypothetical protein
MKMIPMKFYHQRARILLSLVVICLVVYFVTRVFIEI